MRAKKEYFLLIIVIAALSSYLFFRNTDKTHYLIPVIPDIDQQEITTLEISRAGSSIKLNKKDNKWFIMPYEYPTDIELVEKMLRIIDGFTLETLVSEKKSYHLFDLTDDKKITIKTWVDDSLALEFDMGRPAPSWNHTFVKISGNDSVYHAKGNFKSTFDQTVAKLRDKTVLSFDPNEIVGIEIIKGKETIILGKKVIPAETTEQEENKNLQPTAQEETSWEDPDGKKADKTALDSMLAALSSLKCSQYTEEQDKSKFSNPIYTVKIKGLKEYSLQIFDKTDEEAKNYPAVSSENAYPFLIAVAQGDRIMKGKEEMLKKEERK